MSREDTYWSLGLGAMCCPKHHCPMTIYGGCPQCDKEELRIFPKDTDKIEFHNGVWFHKEEQDEYGRNVQAD